MITKNLDAERQVIGQVLLGEDCPDLSERDFYAEEHKQIWSCLKQGIVTIPEIAQKVQAGNVLPYISEILDKHLPTKNLDRYVEALKRATKTRQLRSLLNVGIEKLEAGQDAGIIATDLIEQFSGLRTIPLATLISDWVGASEGTFTTSDLHREFGIVTRSDKQHLSKTLGRLVDKGMLERNPARAGSYRIIDNSLEPIDFDNIETRELDLGLPLGLHTMYRCRPKHIIVVAGEFNTGKTGVLLNIIKLNMDSEHWKNRIHYFNSEAGPSELKNRLEEFDRNVHKWNANFYERSTNFADVIKPDELNLIDFMEVDGSEGKEFWRLGAMITEVHNKLNDGVAVIAIQKNRGQGLGLGGERGTEKPRLYITLSGLKTHDMEDGPRRVHTATIEKLKESKLHPSVNPNGWQIHYTIGGGAVIKEHRHFENGTFWHEPHDEDEDEKARYHK